MAAIKQRTSTDCGIATLANATGLTYEQAKQAYGTRQHPGVSMQETCAVLLNLGYLPVYTPLHGFRKASGLDDAVTQSLQILLAPAILQVISNNTIHQVFFDGKNIIDPSTRAPETMSISDYQDVIDAVFVIKASLDGVILGAA